MQLPIIQIGDPVLETKAKRVEVIRSKKIQTLIDNLIDTCQVDVDKTAGISAPQVGESLAISICRRTDLEERKGKGNKVKWEVMINPEITYSSKKDSIVWEGCLSIGQGEKTLFGPVSRPDEIKVKYQTREGEWKELGAQGFFSHVVQHEVDHNNGILFLQYVPNPDKNIYTSKELDEYMDRHDAYPPVL